MSKTRTVLVTGGLGYIGSHACVALAAAGYRPLVVDNLGNAKATVLERLRELTSTDLAFHRADVRDGAALGAILGREPVEAVLHFAGWKAVGESVEKPLMYYDNNVGGTLALLAAMAEHGVRRLVFSSSATVYGEPERLPLTEDHALRPVNPYAKNKLMIEHILADYAVADAGFRYAALRYFNPIGAHPSGRIGEDPRGVPNNLLPYVAQVAVGRRPSVRVWGRDYATPDGTGVRDYIHVMDLAQGHVAALEYLERRGRSITANLGTGRGNSVLEVVKAFERASGKRIALEFHPRRPGDVAQSYADPSLASRELGWRAQLSLEAMCRDAWRWQSQNPEGYPD
ncbi:MAG TPA: UDP-glucose 4-epimerase GalE [Burkholderiales bacterium]|jgi:UDP-glucose 4-epimerase|nr:UDP-glucose 4-epimerase GalE [Burkholderiales bacterium]